MFASYVSEASPGCRYVLGACERNELRGRCGRDGTAGAAAQQHRSTRLIAHTEYYYTLCAITTTARRPIFSPDLFCRLGFLSCPASAPDFCKESVTFACSQQRICGFCLISSKNRCPKHRFFALFRRGLKRVRAHPSREPDVIVMSEQFAGKAHHV